MDKRKVTAAVFVAAYIATIFVANWLIAHFGIVPVGFGLYAPAAVYAAGLAFTFRDLAQDQMTLTWGRNASRLGIVAAIVIGALLSALVSPAFALASGTAFLVSEGLDFAVYTPLREQGRWLTGVFASNVVGLVVDSALFLWLAFGSLEFFWGQVVGKLYMTIAAVLVLAVIRHGKEPVVA